MAYKAKEPGIGSIIKNKIPKIGSIGKSNSEQCRWNGYQLADENQG